MGGRSPAVSRRPGAPNRGREFIAQQFSAMLWAGAIVVALAFVLGGAIAGEDQSFETAVKATFLYKFADFVEWPAGTAETNSFVLCAVGDDAVTELMDRSAAGQHVGNRQVVVRHLQRVSPSDGCNAAYLAGSPAQSADDAAAALHGNPVLTISDSARNAGTASIIKFLVAENRVRFDIDDAEAAQDRLFISSKLLSLARRVMRR